MGLGRIEWEKNFSRKRYIGSLLIMNMCEPKQKVGGGEAEHSRKKGRHLQSGCVTAIHCSKCQVKMRLEAEELNLKGLSAS